MSIGQENRTVIATESFSDLDGLLSILESFQKISEASAELLVPVDVTFEVISGRYQKSKAQLVEVSLTDNSIVYDVEITSYRPQPGG